MNRMNKYSNKLVVSLYYTAYMEPVTEYGFLVYKYIHVNLISHPSASYRKNVLGSMKSKIV